MAPLPSTRNAEQAFWHSDDLADGVKKLGGGSSTPHDNPFLALALSGEEAADHVRGLHPLAPQKSRDRVKRNGGIHVFLA